MSMRALLLLVPFLVGGCCPFAEVGAKPPRATLVKVSELREKELRMVVRVDPPAQVTQEPIWRVDSLTIQYSLGEPGGPCRGLGTPPLFTATLDGEPMNVDPGGAYVTGYVSDMFASGDYRAAGYACTNRGAISYRFGGKPRPPGWSRLRLADASGTIEAEIGDLWTQRILTVQSKSELTRFGGEVSATWSSPLDEVAAAWITDELGQESRPWAFQRLPSPGAWHFAGGNPLVTNGRPILHVSFRPVLGKCNVPRCTLLVEDNNAKPDPIEAKVDLGLFRWSP